MGLTYITAKIHSYDEAGTAFAGQFGGQDAVYLLQEVDGLTYETILYVYDGWLMELLCERGWELEPQNGQTITQARSLTVEEPLTARLRSAASWLMTSERTKSPMQMAAHREKMPTAMSRGGRRF